MKRRRRVTRGPWTRPGKGLIQGTRVWLKAGLGRLRKTATLLSGILLTLVTRTVTGIGDSPQLRRWLACACVALTFSALSHHASSVVASWPELQPKSLTLTLTTMPPWLHPRAGQQLAKVVREAQTSGDRPASLLDTSRPQRLADLLGQQSWISAVEEVRSEWPADMHLRFRIRRPMAVVSWRGEDWLLDDLGMALPSGLFRHRIPGEEPSALLVSQATALVLPRFTGLPRAGLGPGLGQGSDARDRALIHGLAVVRDLNQRDMVERLAVAAVDLSNVAGKRNHLASEVVLISQQGTRIEWGRSSASGRLQRTTASKLDHLESVLNRSASLQAVRSLSLRWDDQVFVPHPNPEPAPQLEPEPEAEPAESSNTADETEPPTGT